MDVAFVVQEHPDKFLIETSPWLCFAEDLAKEGIHVRKFDSLQAAWRPFDAMILMVWLDWQNPTHFRADRIVPIMEKYSEYRAAFPDTIQIVLNHVDMCRRASALSYWRRGDPILFRTPAYDRSELRPYPAGDITAFDYVRGSACFQHLPCKYAAGFIGSPSGPRGYRERVAQEVAKVGLGRCVPSKIRRQEHDLLMSSCRIIVCPQGWGEQSDRHWDAWKSGKPVLTDRACDSVELIPGMRLRDGIHYLVYDDPADIPDIVNDWTRPGRLDDLEQIAHQGQAAAMSYDPHALILGFFKQLQGRPTPEKN